MLQNPYNVNSETFKKTLIGKVPVYVWWIAFYALSLGSNYFIDQTTINILPYQFLGVFGLSAETGNMWWVHLVSPLMDLVMFEIVMYIYSVLVTSLTRNAETQITRKDFTGFYRVFYLLVLIVSGLLSVTYFFQNLTIVWGTVFFKLVPRFGVTLLFFFYLKKIYLNDTNTHIMLKAMFVPYFVFEIFMIVWTIL